MTNQRGSFLQATQTSCPGSSHARHRTDTGRVYAPASSGVRSVVLYSMGEDVHIFVEAGDDSCKNILGPRDCIPVLGDKYFRLPLRILLRHGRHFSDSVY